MGLFDDYGIDADSIKESNFDIEDGTYLFEVAEAETLDGTANKPDTTFFYIDYQLEDEDGEAAGSTREFFTLAEDGDSETRRVQQSLSFFKSRLKSLGVTDLSNFDGSEIIGLKGSLRLASTPGKGANRDKMYQNIKSLRLSEEEEAPAPKKAAPAKKAAKPAAKPKPAPAPEPDEDDDSDENPFGG